MATYGYEPIFEVTRGKTVESVHYGAVAVCDASGNLYAWYGDPASETFLRSSAKPFQALPFYEQGGQAVFGLTDQEVALTCASHAGMDEHVQVVGAIQTKTGVQESDLMCGVHPIRHKPTVEAMQARGEAITPNRHNCSGKHTAMIAYTHLRGDAPAGGDPPYIDLRHPIQQEILRVLAEMCGLRVDEIATGIDGCSVPTFSMPLRNAAWGFARLLDPAGLPPARAQACALVARAMRAYPVMVAGPDGFDTLLMQATQGRVLSKGGAEGYQAVGLPPGALGEGSPALGIAIKIADGDLSAHSRPLGDPLNHARPAVTLEVLRQLGALAPAELAVLEAYGPEFQIKNWRKLDIGMGRPSFTLRREA